MPTTLSGGEARRPFFACSPRYISSMACVPAAQALSVERRESWGYAPKGTWRMKPPGA